MNFEEIDQSFTPSFGDTQIIHGKDGKDGIDGKDGVDGRTPFIGENENWWIGTTDTGVKARGVDGADGYTPIRGTDYWTESDKSEIVEDMKNEGYIKDTDLSAHTEDKNNPHNVTAAQLGLDKVDNTSDEEKRVLYAQDAGYAEHAQRAGSAEAADSALYDFDGNNIADTYATKGEVSAALGDISSALDSIIALQNSYIGGTSA